MKGSAIRAKVLSIKIISNCDPALLKSLKASKDHISLGIITTDIDDISYVALDEATKRADIKVVYAKSMYAGASNASTKLAGEFIGIISGKTPSDIQSGLEAAVDFIENDGCFYSANDEGNIVYFAHCISRTGSYISQLAKVPQGTSVAYLIAPPLEAVFGLDAALKAAQVDLKVFYGPPTQTNFAGGLLEGEQSAVQSACDAFAEAVCFNAENPLRYYRR